MKSTHFAFEGFTIRQCGIGDGLQFTSLPENYFRATGRKLVDVSQHWAFDFNPYVERGKDLKIEKVLELWNFGPQQYEWPTPRKHLAQSPRVYMSNAEIHASVFKVPTVLNRPRLYKYENFPFEQRKKILFHSHGRSHGELPWHVVDHIVKKYSTSELYHIGAPGDADLGLPKISTPTLWELSKVISEARMLIGIDSGPAWIAACYPDVVVKKIRTKFQFGYREPQDWVPLEIENVHSYWDDRAFQIFNTTENDMGFTQSFKKL